MLEARRIHLIGIGGSGLSAIAQVLLERGYQVSGSDRQETPLAQRLQKAGARVYYGHHPDHVGNADLVLRSSAVPDDNVEVQAARVMGIPVLKRAEFLPQLTSGNRVIAVAGTHGKTTTTAMIVWLLSFLALDPSFIIGGVSLNLNANAHAGKGSFFVIEADEYDGMFLGLRPEIAVITNVELDHPDLFPTFEHFYATFYQFASSLQPDGMLIVCGDDPGANRLRKDAQRDGLQVVTYGAKDGIYDYTARNLQSNPQGGFSFEAVSPNGRPLCSVALRIPGKHNVFNALAALVVVDVLGLSVRDSAQALGEFQGTGRRFEVRGEAYGVTVIDDYAHHPTEIRATLAAACSHYPGKRIWAVWQPHTFSRLRALWDDFISAFEDATEVIVTDIYAAREKIPADGFSSSQVVEAMKSKSKLSPEHIRYIPRLDQVRDFLLGHLQDGDVLLVLSAGDADQISRQVLEALQVRREK